MPTNKDQKLHNLQVFSSQYGLSIRLRHYLLCLQLSPFLYERTFCKKTCRRTDGKLAVFKRNYYTFRVNFADNPTNYY